MGMSLTKLNQCVYLDTELTGLAVDDEVLALAIVDADGTPLLDTLVRPVHRTEWPDTEQFHRITPADIVSAPTLEDLGPAISQAVADRVVVTWPRFMEWRHLGDWLAGAQRVHCCARAWATHAMARVRKGNKRYTKQPDPLLLVGAAALSGHEWQGPRYNALADALAIRAVWWYVQNRKHRLAARMAAKARRAQLADGRRDDPAAE